MYRNTKFLICLKSGLFVVTFLILWLINTNKLANNLANKHTS